MLVLIFVTQDKSALQSAVEQTQREKENLKAENIKLYEKLQFVQRYQDSQKKRADKKQAWPLTSLPLVYPHSLR